MVIGLETHVELSTKTKIFCPCSTQFGGEPNTHVCPVCTGQPGSLPVLNGKVVEYAVKAGVALGCRINLVSKMDRKHYVYPDLPKAYQISQYDEPLCEKGRVTLSNGREIGITRIHIEEDAGKLVHEGEDVFIDYNRGGVPLIEIVTEPDFRSPEEAVEYLEKLQSVMRTAGVSDCRMQEGSLRCDVNVSLRLPGEDFGTRAEIKNLNSFTSVLSALRYEYERQSALLDKGERVVQETRHWNADLGETMNMRGKENADDYRYFPEPDITPIVLSEEDVARWSRELPEMPDVRKKRYIEELGLPEDDASLLVKYLPVAEYFEKASEGVSPKTVDAFLITQMFSVITTEKERENWAPKTSAEQLNELTRLLESGKISRNVAKKTLARMLETGQSALSFLSPEDLEGFDSAKLPEICRAVIEANEKSAADFRGGKEKALKALVGAVMRETKGRADAIEAEKTLRELL